MDCSSDKYAEKVRIFIISMCENLFLKIVGMFLCTMKISSIIESIFEYLNRIEKLLHRIFLSAFDS